MSEQGHIDQVDAETMAEMRAHLKEFDWRETEETGEDVDEFIDGKTDAEILAKMEERPGGIDQFQRDMGLGEYA
jgi:hypothetical protein